jgi:hypothetical protein
MYTTTSTATAAADGGGGDDDDTNGNDNSASFSFYVLKYRKGKTLVPKSIIMGQFPDGHNRVRNITTLKDNGNICPLASQKLRLGLRLKWQQA